MAIDLRWDNDENTIIMCEFPPQWTWDEMFEVLDKVKTITADRTDTVGAIIDVSKGITIPGGSIFSPETRDNALKMISLAEDRRGPIVIVGGGNMIKMLVGAVSLLDRKAAQDISYVDTIDEARSTLNKRLTSQ